MHIPGRLQQWLSLIVSFLLILAVSIRRDSKVLGHDLQTKQDNSEVVRTLPDGTIVISTKTLAGDIIGYSGIVPLEISVKEGIIVGVEALTNAETPDFFEQASQLLPLWNGLSIAEGQALEVDAVSGATFSSKAIIGNVQRGLEYAAKEEKELKGSRVQEFNGQWSMVNNQWSMIVGLIVVLMAAIVPLFVRNKAYRLVQQVLNVLVLGLWCGSFLSYSALISFMSNGINVIVLPVAVVMLITALVYPLFGKRSHYCTHVCPFGSLQELAGRCVGYKVRISARVLKGLDIFRQALWALLMVCLLTGVWADWIDYEPFSAFLFESASWVVIAIAIVFMLLSTVVMRPYCRFVCPTGTILRLRLFNIK
ncbi:MAG: FMN-binding protein [Bacteroidaceae bacterium]|nr:FMN-binding protein [Bacteroidaceae bacterium]